MQCNLQGQTALCGLPSLPPPSSTNGTGGAGHILHLFPPIVGATTVANGGAGSARGGGSDDQDDAAEREFPLLSEERSRDGGGNKNNGGQGQGGAAPFDGSGGLGGAAGEATGNVVGGSVGSVLRPGVGGAEAVSVLNASTSLTMEVSYFPSTTLDNYRPPERVRAYKPEHLAMASKAVAAHQQHHPSHNDGNESIASSICFDGSAATEKILSKRVGSDFGIEVLKVTSQGKFQPRRLAIAHDNRTLLINTKRTSTIRGLFKKPDNPLAAARRIDVSSIVRVETGQRTRKFGMARTMSEVIAHSNRTRSPVKGLEKNLGVIQEKFANSISIVYRSTPGAVASSIFGNGYGSTSGCRGGSGGGRGKGAGKEAGKEAGGGGADGFPPSSSSNIHYKITSNSNTGATTPSLETLDLVVPSTRDFEALVLALHDVMTLYRKYRADTHRDVQLLQHLWIHAGLTLNGRASASHWIEMARDGLGAPFGKSKLHSMYKTYCASERIGPEKGGILISEAVGLLQTLRVQSAIESALTTNSLSPSSSSFSGRRKGEGSVVSIGGKQQQEQEAIIVVDPMSRIWEEIAKSVVGREIGGGGDAAGSGGCGNDDDLLAALSLHHVLSQESFDDDVVADGRGVDGGMENHAAAANGATVIKDVSVMGAGGAEETVTAVQYLSFLKTTQGEADATIVQVYDLFSRLNAQTKVSASSALTGGGEFGGGGGVGIGGRFGPQNDSETDDSANEARLEKVRMAGVPKNRISKSTLVHFLLSDANDAFDPAMGTPGQMDMTHPLSSYWINTSHDTYLRRILPTGGGGGVLAEADATMYGEALRRGFRCVELDLWDGPNADSDPEVRYSGPPSGRAIPLKDVLHEVKSFLTFNPRSFPIILSLEDRCTVPFQERTAALLKKVLGDSLYVAADDKSLHGNSVDDDDDILPSPQSLRGKVVIKSKRPRTLRPGATVLNDDFDADNDMDPQLPRPAIEEDDISVSGDDDIINPVASSVVDGYEIEKDRSPEEQYELAEKEAADAKAAATQAETKAFNLQVKAKRAEEYSAKLLKKLGWDVDEIEERRAQLNAEMGGAGEAGDEEEGVEKEETRGGEIATKESSTISEPVPVRSNPLERIRVSPAKCLVEDEAGAELDSGGDAGKYATGDERHVCFAPSGSTLFSDDLSENASIYGTFDDDDLKDDDLKDSDMKDDDLEDDDLKDDDLKEGWFDSLFNRSTLDGDSLPGTPSLMTSYTAEGADGSTISNSQSVFTKSTTGRQTAKESQSRPQIKRALTEPEEEGLEVELLPVSSSEENIPPPSPARRVPSSEGGMEVQHFFATSVNQAKLLYAEAYEAAMIAAKAADRASHALRKPTKALKRAEEALYAAVQKERDLALIADKAAAEARSNHEHADVAKQRVATVRDLLSKCQDQAATSETVAVTAVTEATISEERASEAEKRARKAQSTASKERKRADEETKKEEKLERDKAVFQAEAKAAAEKAMESKAGLEKLTDALDKVEEQIRILEENVQFRKEREQQMAQQEESGSSGGLSLALVRKHREKKIEQQDLAEHIVKVTAELEAAEINRKSVEDAYFTIRLKTQAQAKLASAARRLADQSTTVAEQLAEYAEEEREAANMRKEACEKAEACVNKSRVHCSSMEAQLSEAERAATEAANLARTSREKADKLAHDALLAKDIQKEQEDVERLREEKDRAERTLAAANAVKEATELKAAESKAHLDTAHEVFYQAKRVSTAEAHRVKAERQVEINAIESHDAAVLLREKAEDAKVKAAEAVQIATDKVIAAKHARDIRDKKAKVHCVSLSMAKITLFHSTKLNYWEKSMALPASHMHSISEGKMIQMVKDGTFMCDQWKEFNTNHISRVFPSRHAHLRAPSPNFNPVIPWALGCQMVAMNFQACDDHLLLNDGRFRVNASSGYVLKPERLTDGRKARRLGKQSVVNAEFPCRLNIMILSGYNIPPPENRMGRSGPISPRIRMALYDGTDSEGKSATQVHLTAKVRRNGLNPIWNEDKGASFYSSTPDVAMLLITVWDSGDDNVARDDFIAAASIPVSCIREGYRSIPLFDAKHSRSGCHAFSSLLVKVESRQC